MGAYDVRITNEIKRKTTPKNVSVNSFGFIVAVVVSS